MQDRSRNYWSASLLILLIASDLSFIGLGILYSWGYANADAFSLGAERGYSEMYQYIKLFWVSFLLSWFAWEKREAVYVVGALLFLYFLLDDSFAIHETAGGFMVGMFELEPAFGLRGQDYGELGTSALVGGFFLVVGWWAYRHSGSLARRIGLFLLMGVCMLALFGVGMDVAHQFFGAQLSWTKAVMGVLEDGGELIVVSAICWFVYSLANQELSPLRIPSPVQAHKISPSGQFRKEQSASGG